MLAEVEWKIKNYGHGFGMWHSINNMVDGQLGCSYAREMKIKNGSEKQMNNIQGENKSADFVSKHPALSKSVICTMYGPSIREAYGK